MKTVLYKFGQYLSSKYRPEPEKWKGEPPLTIKPAFISGGVQYFEMTDPFNGYCQRVLEAMDIYEEWMMRITRKDLERFISKLDEILESPHISIQEIIKVKFSIQERLNYALPNKEIIYKFASVVYFDESESPYHYDTKYNEQKIERWKKDMDIPSFFLTVPIRTLIPLPDLSKIDLEPYLKVIEQAELLQAQSLSLKAS